MQNTSIISILSIAFLIILSCGRAKEPENAPHSDYVTANVPVSENIQNSSSEALALPEPETLAVSSDKVEPDSKEVALPSHLDQVETVPLKKQEATPEKSTSSDLDMDDLGAPTAAAGQSQTPSDNEQTPSNAPSNEEEKMTNVLVAPSHSLWDALTRKHISSAGNVNYKGIIQDQVNFEKYLDLLADNPPKSSWSENEQLAYWINAYNAFTVKLITDHYPLNSITDLEEPWKQTFIKLGTQTYSLNDIEHEIIRKQFEEPRIHFAVNCAAKSCPRLRNGAFLPEQLDTQLEEMATSFVNNHEKNQLSNTKIGLSKIFEWYQDDFTKEGSLLNYVQAYSKVKISPQAKISFLEYDWSLNE